VTTARPLPFDGELALARWSLRFARPDTELDYRAWYLQGALASSRMGMLSSIGNWVAAVVGLELAVPGPATAVTAWALLVMIPLCCACIAFTYRPRLHAWVFPCTIFINALTGCSLVGLGFSVLKLAEVMMAANLIVAFFGFTIFRLRPAQAIVAVLPYTVLNQGLLIFGDSLGASTSTVIIHSVSAWIAFVSGLMACALFDRLSRESYRQERTIAAQQVGLERERARSEALLLNVLPATIAQRLKSERRIAEHFPDVTVLFGDIAGFTQLSQRLPPAALVDTLDEIFSAFDDIADKHGLEKIKTIGDAYMVVGGLPAPRADHAEAIARMALEMRDLIANRQFANGERLSMRIGIHSGPVVAGVIGKRKFIYDLWGDTVNVASRMESHGVEGSVQVTEATRERLEGRFVLSRRGAVQVKGKGEMNTWFLERTAGS
jgi:class 3 adenylate cyclase